ncbi:MAG: LysR family transcriptional regulator [Clostridia bacterium]|nr:LysR family transcriptional regulator [Clostridia bacterium]
MDVRVLRYFLAVAREESISRAAEVLHITQPTLSRQLAQMEDELGVRLFDRGSRRIALTAEGLLLRRRAEEIVALVDKTERELTEQDQLIDGHISIGCGETAAVQLLAELCETFHRQYPLVKFELVTSTAEVTQEQIDRGLIDVGLLLEPVSKDKYEFIRLPVAERWVALMRPDDPLAQREFVTPDDLAEKPLIFPRRPGVQSELASWFGDRYDALHILFVSNLSTNSAIMVQQGLGYNLAIEGSLPFWDRSRIALRPLRPELRASSVLAWKRQQPASPAVTRFIEHIRRSIDPQRA